MSPLRVIWIVWCLLWAFFWVIVSLIPPWLHDVFTIPLALASGLAILPAVLWPSQRRGQL